MISKIVVDNFTSFNHFEFDLIENKTDKKAKNLAIIYGENGIGKTCLVRSIELLKKSAYSLISVEGVTTLFGSMMNSGGNDEAFSMFLGKELNELRVSGYFKKYYKINATKEMKLLYEFILNKKKYVYSLIFDKGLIVQEKLYCNGENVFSCHNTKLDLNPKFFIDEIIANRCHDLHKMYFGDKHTFLSCLLYAENNVSQSFFKTSVSKNLQAFLRYIQSIIVVTKDDEEMMQNSSIPNFSFDFLNPIANGDYNDKLEKKKNMTEMALSMFFSSLYSNINSVEYQIETSDSGKRRYRLYFVENKNNEIVQVPYELESTGTKKLATLFTVLYEMAKNKRTIVIDEIDNGINDILLKSVFESLESKMAGQLIVTTHNTLLLRYPIKKNIFLLDRDNDNAVISYSLDEFGRKIQSGTDLVGQYLKGLYGGVPQSGAFSMEYIIEAINSHE